MKEFANWLYRWSFITRAFVDATVRQQFSKLMCYFAMKFSGCCWIEPQITNSLSISGTNYIPVLRLFAF